MNRSNEVKDVVIYEGYVGIGSYCYVVKSLTSLGIGYKTGV